MLIWSPLYKLLQLDLCGQKCYYTVGAAHATLSCECGLNVLKLYLASYYTLVDFAVDLETHNLYAMILSSRYVSVIQTIPWKYNTSNAEFAQILILEC